MSSPSTPARDVRSLSRRRFLQTSAAASSAFLLVPRGVVAGAGGAAPSEKLNIAGIGVGGFGAANLQNLSSQNIVALCDVDPGYAAKTIAKFPGARLWTDYRQMLEKQKDIDAVLIATPDHTHAVIAMAALQAGKHVYCQKPLCHDLYEARRLAEAAGASKVATQMGIQGHSGEGLRLICEWLWDGAIGDVREVEAWCSLTYYPWGHASWSSKWGAGRPADTPPLPDKLNWDLWLGPAPERPYHPAYHPRVWRCWWDFGNGMMGDRGAHTLDPIVTALKLGAPTSVEATSTDHSPEVHPIGAIVTFRFPARGALPPVKLTWYEGTRPPRPPELEDGAPLPKEGGALFRGSKGLIVCGVYGDSPRLLPDSLMKSYARPAKTLPRIKGTHEMEWVNAAKEGRLPGAHFGYSGPLTETCLLGNIAKRMDARLEWDAANLRVTNLAEANRHVRIAARKGWDL